jgi:hypothetical protein
MTQKTIIIIAASVLAAILIIAAIGGYLYWANSKKTRMDGLNTAEDITNSATKGVLPSIQTNPLENKPDVNPADKANPFANIRINPF